MLILLVVALAAGLALWSRFCRWERDDRRELVLAFLVGTILVDLLFYASQNDVPVGLFRPVIAGQSFRLSELVIATALLARLTVHGGPKRVTVVGMAWAAFSAWYIAAAAGGMLLGNPVEDVLYQVKAVIYIAGGMAVAIGVKPARLVSVRAFGAWVLGLGAVVLVMIPVSLGSDSFALRLPGLSIDKFGEIGADASSALVVVGTAVLLVEGCRRRRRGLIALAALPMVGSVFAGTQRAAIVGLAATAVLVVVALVGPTWRVRLRTTPTSVFLAIGIAAVLATSLALFEVRKGERLPIVDAYEETFFATRKQQSADVRVVLWREAGRLYDERPLVGHGLGVPFEVALPNQSGEVIDSGFHNIVWDLLVRTGLVGLGLFIFAMGVSLREGIRGWRRHADARVAALALAAVVGAGSLLTKGMFEDLFEKNRLASLLGVCLGIMVAVGTAVRSGSDEDDDVVVVAEPLGGTTAGRIVRPDTEVRSPAWS